MNSSLSFSTTFAFAMYPEIHVISGHGIVFVISPSTNFIHGVAGKYFGLFNSSSNGNSTNHIFAVELDTIQDLEFQDIDSNHVGIDVNGLISNASSSAGYFSEAEGKNKTLDLLSSKPMQVWIEYDDKEKVVKVTMAPLGTAKPSRPLVISRVDLSPVLLGSMYVGFSSSTGSVASSHYLLGWSFKHGGLAQGLDVSKLPSLPRVGKKGKLGLGSLILVIIISVVVVVMGLGFYIMRRKKYEEVLEDWEQEYLLQRFSYKDLYRATKGFKDKELLGSGGFGKVYKGILPSTKAEVAVKRVSHGSGQGMREFVAEIACLGRLRHRNLVQLLGYCRRKGELLLVYDYMPNGSLDKYLYYNNGSKPNLSWFERFKIMKGVASSLLYLHEEWEQVVVHRDVKASNVLLDSDLNARLGDFGLARLYDHGSNPQTTHIVGTVGYLAPELTRRGKASTSTDVFSFGILVLEVTCGKSPIISLEGEDKYLVDYVYEFWKSGRIIETKDPKLEGGNHVVEEIELVLKVGMLCAHPRPEGRPSMRQVVQFLERDCSLDGAFPGDAEITLFSSVNQQSQTRSDSFQPSSGGASAFSS